MVQFLDNFLVLSVSPLTCVVSLESVSLSLAAHTGFVVDYLFVLEIIRRLSLSGRSVSLQRDCVQTALSSSTRLLPMCTQSHLISAVRAVSVGSLELLALQGQRRHGEGGGFCSNSHIISRKLQVLGQFCPQ